MKYLTWLISRKKVFLKVHEMRETLIDISAQHYTVLCRTVLSGVPSTRYRSRPEWPELIIISRESHFRQRRVLIHGYFRKKSSCRNNVTFSKWPAKFFFIFPQTKSSSCLTQTSLIFRTVSFVCECLNNLYYFFLI